MVHIAGKVDINWVRSNRFPRKFLNLLQVLVSSLWARDKETTHEEETPFLTCSKERQSSFIREERDSLILLIISKRATTSMVINYEQPSRSKAKKENNERLTVLSGRRSSTKAIAFNDYWGFELFHQLFLQLLWIPLAISCFPTWKDTWLGTTTAMLMTLFLMLMILWLTGWKYNHQWDTCTITTIEKVCGLQGELCRKINLI